MQGKIALEEHFSPPADFDKRLVYFGSRLPNWPDFARRQEAMWDVGLKEMDDNGVEHTIVSLGAPAVQSILDPADALDLARRTNDYLAERCVQHPGRFSGFAAIPMQDPEAAATELERLLKAAGQEVPANKRILDSTAQKLGLDPAKVIVTVDQHANTSAASVPLALDAAGDRDAAISELLELVRRDRKWNDDAGRKQLVTLFEAMGPTDPRTIEARRKLSGLLFS